VVKHIKDGLLSELCDISVMAMCNCLPLVDSTEDASLSPGGMVLSGDKDRGWPGIGMVNTMPLLLTPGKMRCKCIAAASAFKREGIEMRKGESERGKGERLRGKQW
jgi:hypothetical protein